MNIKKHFKKFILVFVLLISFNFCCPKSVHASLIGDIQAAPAKIFWLIEEGVLTGLNNLFTEDSKNAENKSTMDEDGNITRELKIYLTPETIIKGKFLLLDANIFKNIDEAAEDEDYYYDDDTTTAADSETATNESENAKNADETEKKDLENSTRSNIVKGKKELRETVSGWYVVLRNFSIVMLLSVLVYVGIRMVISTVAQDKAKYKAMFKDWLVALCLLIAMHIFMIGILNISSEITKALGSGKNSDLIGNVTDIIQGVLSNDENEEYTYTKSSTTTNITNTDTDSNLEDTDTDSDSDSNEGEEVYTLSDAYANILVLGAIIVYTIIFAIKYLKREFTIIFLIILGPISCITYPIDKIGDGKAQAFNRWFSEFLYQVIIQPFHLLLYVVLIGTAANLANTNVIYALVCFAVMGPAEKFIKEMFGFKDKLGSPLGNLMKAGMARDFVNKATSRIMGGSGGNSEGKNNIREKDNDAINPPRSDLDNNLLGGGDEVESSSTENQDPRQAMLDAYDENFGSPDYDPQEREAMANELPSDNRLSFTAEELREQGLDDETIAEIMKNSPEMAGDAAGMAALNSSESGHEAINGETEGDRAQDNQELQRQLNNDSTWNRIKATHARRMAEKYGTTNKAKQWRRRIGRGTAKGIRALAKGTLIAGAATAAAAGALVTGNGAEAFAIMTGAAALGARSGMRTIKGVARGVKGTTRDYYRNGGIPVISGLGSDSYERAFNSFESNPQQIQRAEEIFRKNHGHGPNSEELASEMQDRFALSAFKLSDDQIDNAVGRYQELREIPGMSDNKALQQAALESQLADRYKGKFGKEKDMQDAIKAVTKRFTDAGVKDKALAEQNAIRYLNGAAKMNKETMLLPDGKEVIEAPIRIPNVSTQLEIENSSGFGEVEAQRMNEVTLKLVQMDYTTEEIRRIAADSADSKKSAVQVLDNYEAKVEFISSQRGASRQFVAETKGINEKQVSSADLKVEDRRRLELIDKHDIPEEKIDQVRKIVQPLENKRVGKKVKKTQDQLAWEISHEIKGKDKKGIEVITDRIAGELADGRKISSATAKKEAQTVVRQAKKLAKLNGK